MQLRRVSGFRKTALAHYTQTSLRPGCPVWTDGLACFTAIAAAGGIHLPRVTDGDRSSAKKPDFKLVNTMLGNGKNAITGIYFSMSKKHLPSYSAVFEYRFNRRYNLPTMIERLAFVAITRHRYLVDSSPWRSVTHNLSLLCDPCFARGVPLRSVAIRALVAACSCRFASVSEPGKSSASSLEINRASSHRLLCDRAQ